VNRLIYAFKKINKNYKNYRIILQGSHYFQIRGRSDFSFRELTGRSGRQQKEVGRLLGEEFEKSESINLRFLN
jgi:hypothetical protein